MNKIFFRDRIVYLGSEANSSGDASYGTIYNYSGRKELKKQLDLFRQSEEIPSMVICHNDPDFLMDEFTACFKYIGAGGGVVLNGNGEFLVIERRGVWDLPKGKMEQGEDFRAAALREVEEETGLKGLRMGTFLQKTFHTYPIGDLHVLKETRWYELQYPGIQPPDLQQEEGITGYRWVVPGNAGFIRENSFASILDLLENSRLL